MRIALLLLLACAFARAEDLTLKWVLSRPEGKLPYRFRFFKDSSRIAYLKERAEGKRRLSDLWVYDIGKQEHEILVRARGRQKLTAAEIAAKERQRDRSFGVSQYRLNPANGSVLFAFSGDLYRQEGGTARRLTKTKQHERNARWSPDGNSIAYVMDGNVYVLRDGRPRRLTWHGVGKTRCGLPEFIAMEELGRHEGFWWSKDSKHIAYVRTESHAVPLFRFHDYLDETGKAVEQEYPRAGDPNVLWWLKVVPVNGGREVSMRVEGEYLVRVEWTPGGKLAVQVSDRAQRNLRLYLCDAETGRSELALREHDKRWVAFHNNLRFLKDGRFLWTSERSGRRHIYVWEQGELTQVTKGDWDVAGVLGVDEQAGVVHFTGAKESPHERHLYRVGLDGRGLMRLTKEPGWHGVQRSPDGKWFLDKYSSAGVPPRIVLRDADGEERMVFSESKPLPDMPKPELITLPAKDGTPLHAMLYRSKKEVGPAIIHCYGGPGSHIVRNRWGGGFHLWHARMAQKGYSVLMVDGRGTGGYGLEWCRNVAGRLCDWEVRDQAAGARWLAKQPYVDGKRIGIWGWSYGGTLTLMCLLHARDVFAAGVSVAPVTESPVS